MNKERKQKVVVGLSGGVDSSVTAHLLIKQGYEVIGLFMRNWNDASAIIDDECPWVEDAQDALLVADKLGIPFQVIDLSNQYKTRIVDYMFDEYANGRTPNPDVLCNREIKFDIFLDTALGLGADFVATGHYCQKETIQKDGQDIHRLLAGADKNKDQSYFLCQVNQYQLSKALFPIGGLQKSEVRKIAHEQELVTADKKDSQGLCFIGKVRLPDFLQQQLKPKEGKIIQIDESHDYIQHLAKDEYQNDYIRSAKNYDFKPDMGKVVGKHNGAHYFTIGQRKGLNVGGTKEALFVIGTDVKENIIYVGEGKNHPALYKKALLIANSDLHWLREDLRLENGESQTYDVRIRYRQALTKAILHQRKEGLYIEFDESVSAVAPGQFAVWYQNDELIGSGIIA